ncbi:MAG: ElyC/SanA/YdcF family protein [Leptospiraceae bacterium]|nr:ElyC/SanA/YdcF family protein [Leptospiraceae bacterium]
MTKVLKTVILWVRFILRVIFISLFLFICIDLSFEISYLFRDTWNTSSIDNVKKYSVAIVPGAAVYGSKPSPILKDRLELALKLYKKGKVKKILLSGDNEMKSYNELTPMLSFMLKNNVASKDIFLDYYGLRTYDTMLRAKLIFEIKDAIIVTQRFHQPRATFIAERLGLEIGSLESDQRSYRDSTRYRAREFLARNLALIELLVNPIPDGSKLKKFPILGNGEMTWKERDLFLETKSRNLGTEDL